MIALQTISTFILKIYDTLRTIEKDGDYQRKKEEEELSIE